MDQPHEVGAVAPGLVARDLELDRLAGRDREPVGVAVDRWRGGGPVLSSVSSPAGRRRGAGRCRAGRPPRSRSVSSPRILTHLAALPGERADAVLLPRLRRDQDVLARLRLAAEVVHDPLEVVGVRPERRGGVLGDQLVGDAARGSSGADGARTPDRPGCCGRRPPQRLLSGDPAPVHGEQRVGARRAHHLVDQDVLVVGVRDAQVARPVADRGRAADGQPARVLDGREARSRPPAPRSACRRRRARARRTWRR